MKRLLKTIIIPLSLGILAASCSAQQSTEHMGDGHSHDGSMQSSAVNTSDTSQKNQSIEAVLNNYSQQINAKNLASMESYVLASGTDFTIFEGKGTNIGWADYRDNHLAPEFGNEDLVFTKYEFTDYRTNVSGDLATATFSINMAYTYKNEDKAFIKHGTAILKKTNGAWKIAHLHTS